MWIIQSTFIQNIQINCGLIMFAVYLQILFYVNTFILSKHVAFLYLNSMLMGQEYIIQFVILYLHIHLM